MFVYVPGSRWENVQGTDHRLAAALARQVPVLWVDPPLPLNLAAGHGMNVLHGRTELSNVAPGITRLRSLSVPGFTRPILAMLANRFLGRAIRLTLRAMAATPVAVMVSAPTSGFPPRLAGRKILFVTDDWVAGAPMMGLSASLVRRTLRRNLRDADIAAAVSPHLAESLEAGFPGRQSAVVVLPNGCDIREETPLRVERSDNAALVGQLNERLDMDLLEAVNDAGVPILVIGPRTERDPQTGRRLDLFLASENVTWLGELPSTELGQHLATAGVGLTPYADTAFNRASFPLKTLDYLAAGIPVVATDLPAVRWLNTGLVAIGSGREEFANRVQQALARPHDPVAEEGRRHFAGLHTWDARATQLLQMLGARTSKQEA
ncbi:hypothetical protein TV39_06195 [Arthrobacter sp. SPG23]|nr:hypothetical protein TV39_06195 [Arthrobacter sp. SPG23]